MFIKINVLLNFIENTKLKKRFVFINIYHCLAITDKSINSNLMILNIIYFSIYLPINCSFFLISII